MMTRRKLLAAQFLSLSLCSLTTIHGLSILDRREAILMALATQSKMIISSSNRSFLDHDNNSSDDESRMNLLVPRMNQQQELTSLVTRMTPTTPTPFQSVLSIPRIGYSLYKTPLDQVELGVQVALQAGIRHFDLATAYGSNEKVGTVLQDYLSKGISNEKLQVVPSSASASATLPTPTTRSQRRAELFISHKVSNMEQSTNRKLVRRAVKQQLSLLKTSYLDLVSIHSPLTDSQRRLGTYDALWELQKEGVVRAVGVCHYGIGPLQEIVESSSSLPAPSVIQLVLSPFHQHLDITSAGSGWAQQHGSAVCCNAWSKLSSTQGPQEGWNVLANIAKSKGMTKAQVLVRWAFQKGYLCVPRSGSKFKIDRAAIVENSYGGVQTFVLSPKEMAVLDGLDEQLPAGRLGIVDGWLESDIVNDQWDPTNIV